MPYAVVNPVIEPMVRTLCTRPYPGHVRGCPNHGKRSTCPPHAPMLGDVLDLDRTVWAVWTTFDLAAHVAKMRAKHPKWSERQLRCCLYWQGGARKRLKIEVAKSWVMIVSRCIADHYIGDDVDRKPPQRPIHGIFCPEAMGVNVTATLAGVGVELEWPPVHVTHQVALVGYPKEIKT